MMAIMIFFPYKTLTNFRWKDILNEMSPYFRKVVVAPQPSQQQIKEC